MQGGNSQNKTLERKIYINIILYIKFKTNYLLLIGSKVINLIF